MADANPYRLPRTVVPERYELTLTPDLHDARFTGEERVELTITETVTEIRLNSVEISVISAQLINEDGTTIDATVAHDEEAEVATISLASAAAAGQWTLHLTFTGILNDKLHGFYRSTFKDDSGKEQVIATTQFEATDARRAFPCWDEPDFKAVFAVTLIVDEQLAAFSNAAVKESTSLGNGKTQYEYEDTMKMSTYLVAFVVGPLVVSETVDVDGVPLRVACVPGKEALTPFALEIGAFALRFFSNYFKIPYPGGKLDMLALPDFAFGAMENLGCVTFRETALLVDPERASRQDVERVADVVAHEIAHMWFGDLVTMKWWEGIWLNEAFATFMELVCVDKFRKDWERWVSFGLSKSAALSLDSLSTTRPIEFEVIRPEEAQGMFDLLTYEKGGSVLRMLEQHLGEQEFAGGISLYLKRHAYGNAVTGDLWDALEESTGQPVRSVMDSWIYQGGHPLVHVSSSDGGKTLTLTQQRFRFLPDDSDATTLWQVPIGIRAKINGAVQSQKLILSDKSLTISFDGEPEWVVVNERANGFFRTSYDTDLLAKITANIKELDSLERFILMTDAWATCLAGRIDLADVISLVKVLKDDNDPSVWGAMLGPMRLLDKVVDDSTRPKLQRFVHDIADMPYKELGWTPTAGEAERTATLRGTVISAMGAIAEDPDVQNEAVARYGEYQKDPSALDQNLVDPVESILATTNDPQHYEQLYAKFKSEASTPQEQVSALQTLACFTEPGLVKRTLEMVSSGEVRTQDAPYTVRVMLTRRGSGADVWEWCEQNWSDLMERFPDNSISRMLDGVTAQVDPKLAERVERFMKTHPVPQAQKSVDQTCERLRVNVAFYQRNAKTVGDLF